MDENRTLSNYGAVDMAQFFQNKYEQNTIKRVMSVPCSVPWQIWVEAAVPALIRAAASIVTPDLKEAIHITSGKSWLGNVRSGLGLEGGGQPKFGRGPAMEMDGAAEMASDEVAAAARWLFRGAEVLDQVAWYAFLSAVALEGAVDWASIAAQEAGCDPRDRAYAGWSNEPFGGVEAGQWASQEVFVDTGPFAPAWGGGVVVSPGNTWYIAGSFNYHNFLTLEPIPVAARIIDEDDGSVFDYDNPVVKPDGSFSPAKVWHKSKNETGGFKQYRLQFLAPVQPNPYPNAYVGTGWCSMYGR